MKNSISFLIGSLLFALAGCSTNLKGQIDQSMGQVPIEKTVNDLKQGLKRGTSQDVESKADAHTNARVMRLAQSPWIGGSMVPVTKVDGLPALFNEQFVLDFGDGRVSIAAVASRLTKTTGVPVRIRSDVYTAARVPAAMTAATSGPFMPNGPAASPTPFPRQGATTVPASSVASSEVISIDAVGMRWTGKLSGFLDHLTNALSLSWEYRDGAVVIMRLVTQTHALAVFPGAQKYATSAGGSSAGSSTQSTSQSSAQTKAEFSDSGSLDAFTAISEAVKSMATAVSGSSVVLNPQTGTVIVTTSKEVQAQIRDYLDAENARLGKMVNVTLDIYTLKTSDSDTQAVNWNQVYKSLSGSFSVGAITPASLASTTAASVTLTKLTGTSAGSSLILNALRSTGNSVAHRPVSLLTLNGKLRTQTGTSTQAYVKETVPGLASASGAAGAPGLKTDTIVSGDVFAVLPVVQPDNSVIVKYNFSLSSLTGITDFSSGSGTAQQTIQVPTTAAVTDGAELRLDAGESVLITGLSRLISSDDSARLTEGAPLIAGGSNKKSLVREHFIVLMRATPM